MANEQQAKVNYTIYDKGALGEVRIADEVVAVIAGIATTEVDGVASMAGSSGGIQKELISRLGMKVLSKGVHLTIEDGTVTADISVVLKYGYSVPEVTAAIQEKVKSEIEVMTGLEVKTVNVKVTDVLIKDE